MLPEKIGGTYSRRLFPSVRQFGRPSVRPSVRPICVRPITSLWPWRSMSHHDLAANYCPTHNSDLKSNFTTISQERSPYWDDVSRAMLWSLSWRSMSQNDLAAKSCPANNCVIWSRILKIFYRNDHHIEMTWRAQNLGRYLEGQGHSMTLQQNRVWPIT